MTDAGDDLCWQVEAACLIACPAARTTILDGWVVRVSGGRTRRTNSLNPNRRQSYDPRPILGAVRRIYSAHGQPMIVRVPTLAPGLDSALDDAGFAKAESPTRTLRADITGVESPDPRDIVIANQVTPRWLATRAAHNGNDPGTDAIDAAMLGRIAAPKCFVSIDRDGRPVAIAYGVLSHRMLVIESVSTAPSARRLGFARRTVRTLIGWARSQGIGQACLQVAADNEPAAGLYHSLGFTRDLYRYHYRTMVDDTRRWRPRRCF